MSHNVSTNFLLEQLEELKDNVDQIFLIVNAIFVSLMQCGFACLEAGSIRSKNVTNILMKNVLDIFISCIAYWLIGYAVAYGQGNSVIGWTYWAGVGIPENKMAHWFFQFVFAATAATIVSGAVAERCHFVAYLAYSFAISGFIYPVVSHWVWSENGWLTAMGYYDFAGSGAVHLLGGAASFTGAVLMGPRIGRFEGKEMPGHSTPLVAIGGMILIAGFLSFNGGSLGTMTTPHAGATVSKVIANTVIGGAGGAMVTLFASKIGLLGPKCWSFSMMLNSALAGMVSVCCSVDLFVFWSSFVSGLISAPVFIAFHYLMICIKVDDPLDAIAVHFGGGLWGLMAGPLFKPDGIVMGPNSENLMQLVYNLAGALSIFTWTVVWCLLMFGLLKICGCLRVTEEEEIIGLDITKHNEPAYPQAGWCETDPNPVSWKLDSNRTGNKQHESTRSKLSTQYYTNHGFYYGDHS